MYAVFVCLQVLGKNNEEPKADENGLRDCFKGNYELGRRS